MTNWETWAAGVLNGVGAPINTTNVATLWAWSNKESGANVMRWNNPLNSSWYMPGAIPENSIPIWSYMTIADGISATVQTLLGSPNWPNPPPPYYYPVILANLRGSIPHQQWGNACANLDTWGTGCGWLTSNYGAEPGQLGEDMLDSTDPIVVRWETQINNIENSISFDPAVEGAPILGWILRELKALKAQVTPSTPQDLSALIAAIQANTAQMAAQTTELNAISAKLNKDLA